jgi:hypothetical protein
MFKANTTYPLDLSGWSNSEGIGNLAEPVGLWSLLPYVTDTTVIMSSLWLVLQVLLSKKSKPAGNPGTARFIVYADCKKSFCPGNLVFPGQLEQRVFLRYFSQQFCFKKISWPWLKLKPFAALAGLGARPAL